MQFISLAKVSKWYIFAIGLLFVASILGFGYSIFFNAEVSSLYDTLKNLIFSWYGLAMIGGAIYLLFVLPVWGLGWVVFWVASKVVARFRR